MILVKTDVIVVGAGPIGSFSALQAAKSDVQVIICEEHSEIGVPSHCTGHVSLAGLKRLNLNLPKNVFENEFNAVTFHSPCGYKFFVQFDFPVTCVINRMLFDQYLARMAKKAGVQILLNTCVDSFLSENGVTKGVSVRRKKKVERLKSEVVIDAEGASSKLLKRAKLPSPNRQMIVNGVQAEVDKIDDINEDAVEVFLNNEFASGFYAWIVPRRDSTAKLGLATINRNPRDCLRQFIQKNLINKKRLSHSDVTNVVYHPLTLGGPISKTFSDGLLIVGDAASQVKSTTGGGIVTGLMCAEIAGRTAAQAIMNQGHSLKILSEYEYRWRKKMGFDLWAMKRFRQMLNGTTNEQLDKIIAICARSNFSSTLQEMKDIDFQGSSLIRMIRKPKFLAITLYLLAGSLLC